MSEADDEKTYRFVYFLQHAYIPSGDEIEDDEEVKDLGVYSSREAAELAVERYKQKRGFRSYRHDFHIDRCALNYGSWETGFCVAGIFVKVLQDSAHPIEYAKVRATVRAPFCGTDPYEIFEILEPGKQLEYTLNDMVRCETQLIDGKEELVAVERIIGFYDQ